MKKFLLLVLAASIFIAYPASASYVTGGMLAQYCKSEKKEEIYSCMHYIAGVVDYHIFAQSMGTTPSTDFCLPDNVSLEELTVVVMQYLQKSPEQSDFIAAPAVIMAMSKAYPCANKKK